MNSPSSWDGEVDVVIVGFGAAGACAAIEAVDRGLDVLVLERFNGGGATRNSGAIIYAGGGTMIQNEAGVQDTPENMFQYLQCEVKDAVSKESLQQFCLQSPELIQWLEVQGVRFEPTLYPNKTSYPPNRYHLYYSGNELLHPYNQIALPAPRGHRPKGNGLSGGVLFNALKTAALKRGLKVKYQSKAQELILDDQGNVIGLIYNHLGDTPFSKVFHKLISAFAYRIRYLNLIFPELNGFLSRIFVHIEKHGRTKRIYARQGVILAAGGFIYNQDMVRAHAPAYLSGTPLGSLGDDGRGIVMGQNAGGATAHMERISAWRFITPPESFIRGILVDEAGKRICNEERYGAQLGEMIVERHGGSAWLICDRDIWQAALRETLAGGVQWFQILLGMINLFVNRKRARTIAALAKKTRIDPGVLTSTIEQVNQRYQTGEADLLNKSQENRQSLTSPPFYAIDCSLKNRVFPCATLSLGGLSVDEKTSQVRRQGGTLIQGLYAVGRNAAGVPSNGYVSGLAIAHCIYSGRQAGRHINGNSTPIE